MASVKPDYHHEPLPTSRSIRVLRLQPAPSRDGQLTCALISVSLDESPKYWALSYTWDAQAPSHSILCQGNDSTSSLNITPNCAAALYQLRHDTEERTFWVDSICIDQSSVDERSAQVELMGEIYLHAEQVVVWLGEGDATTARAINLLQQIGDTDILKLNVDDESVRTLDLDARRRGQQLVHDRARQLTQHVRSDEDDEIGRLFHRPWFHRMWTVQEVVLPHISRVHVHCGSSSISWPTLWLATDVLTAIKYAWNDWESGIRLLRYLSQMIMRHRVPEARRMMDGLPGLELEMTLSYLMAFTRAKLATDPKDKAYALYGLLSYFDISLPRADYQKSLADIYTEITRLAIRHDKSLFVLYSVPSDARRGGLPSWVPDWSDRGWEEADPRFPVIRDRFVAAGTAEAKWSFTSNPLELVVYGKVVDTVMYRGGSYLPTRPPDLASLAERDASGRVVVSEGLCGIHAIYTTMKAWVDVALWTDSYPTGETVGQALKTTLLSDFPRAMADPATGQFDEWLASMRASEEELTARAAPYAVRLGAVSVQPVGLRTLLGALVSSSKSREMGERVRRQMTELPIELRTMLAMTARGGGWGYHSGALAMSAKKAFFRTEGGYFGLAPDRIPDAFRTGDVIALVAGQSMPVVLRRAGDGFRIVSHCYVQGMMYGDAWERGGEMQALKLV